MLKGYDPLVNLVLDDCTEYLRDPDGACLRAPRDSVPRLGLTPALGNTHTIDSYKQSNLIRKLGYTVCRGSTVMLVMPRDGTEEIANPFVQPDGASGRRVRSRSAV